MIEEAIVDAYTDSEQAVSFHVMIEQEFGLPFETTVLGVTVTVKQVRALRAISTRATISRTSFSNYYTFGDLKANRRSFVRWCG